LSPGGESLVSGSGDCTVRLWDTAPLKVRYEARRKAATLRPEAERLVERLLAEKTDAAAVAAALGADRSLSEPRKHPALRALLRRSAPRREKGNARGKTMMSAALEERVVDYLRVHAGKFGLDAGTLKAERVFNWGGFGTHSFRVGDGRRSVHVKLAAEQEGLRRWLAVHELLEQGYRAPRVLARADIPGTPLGGLVFEHIDGETWDTAAHAGLLQDVKGLLDRLHADGPLAARIGDGPRTYRECWELRYREQFEQDLEAVRGCRPACVTNDRLAWMEEEARRVLALASGHDAFAGATSAPCHWDLWPANFLVGRGGAWWVLDWDGLATGDEAEDYATLVWPFVFREGKDWREFLAEGGDGRFAARMDLHLRATTLDYLIDALADWAECDVPEWREEVRRKKEAEHVQYLDWYRSRWG
jgi:thiamine kinase-like enzyme